ncbi:FAD/NAD(P)-binding oxidoreductase [Arthrobacter sp. AL08]|uniref:NAD(P)/FAD-dependent oxidoreductase n=1 Tax=unclassified Arthrobacter TaxID=235627 RepID=UPI001CFFAEAD|nr:MULTISPECIES: FAD/NAD(P)-binding oxidoreductase [unclassified Arthrobacter]MCB5282801.1 Sulfide dehydrogenase [flavocytochrome c] flavoprotein chain [Arthrobacter sp. ES1]MDI3240217.1 FAD/NAD(P)-binding oxidoreductase [Arthrobacter sp. AL05]MDI3276227.1 FAD/NAD(P)-binding oxidoreductase [Arthrobacter sp. AL08]WGZ79015.1 FAD/NAD(P)-binding oxidoreductase [Arthrobacter sp. EM1]
MTMHHEILIVGGGNAGLSVAARLRHAGRTDIGLIEPSEHHYYQPLWTLVGGGSASQTESVRPQATVMPQGVAWIKDAATDIDPERRSVALASGGSVTYDYLVVCPGIQLDWDKIPGMAQALESPTVSSNYRFDLAPKTWDMIRNLKSGTAVFTQPSGPIKCAGAPQKIAYLAADYWQKQGVLDKIRVVMVLPTPGMFGVKVFADELERVVAKYGIEVRFNSEMTSVDPAAGVAVITDNAAGSQESLHYDLLHVVPPQSAPDWLKRTPLADPANPAGYVDVDKHTMQHKRYPEVFALGDAGSTPNSKTGAAIRKQAPVLVKNLLAAIEGQAPAAQYGGYSSCPLTTARGKMLLAEFDYTLQPAPSIPFIDTTKERSDMWLLKRYGLPFMYWNLILKGRI